MDGGVVFLAFINDLVDYIQYTVMLFSHQEADAANMQQI